MAKRCACIFSSSSARSVVAERELAVPAVRRTWLKPARRRLVQALNYDMKHVMAEVQKVAAGETPFSQVGGCVPLPAVRRTWLKPARRRLVQALKDDMKHVMAGETPFFQVGGCVPLPAVRRSWLHEAAACPPRVGLSCFPYLRALDAGAGGRRARGHAVAAPRSRLRRLRQPVCCVRAAPHADGHVKSGAPGGQAHQPRLQ